MLDGENVSGSIYTVHDTVMDRINEHGQRQLKRLNRSLMTS